LSPIESIDSSPAGPLVDLPLRSEALAHGFAFPLAATAADSGTEAEPPGATLASRAIAFAADLAGASLAVTLALLGAVAATGRAPSPGGLPWVAAFGLGFSFVFVVLPLTLFGRTVGMSLAGLAARAGPSGRRLTTGEAARRWAGTAMTALALGLPLLFTARDPLRPTPADRMSGRTLARDIDS
jgi:hypothetical protein